MKNFRMQIFLPIVFICLLTSCNKDDIPIDKSQLLIGNWEFVISSEEDSRTVYLMQRTKDFSEKDGAISFSADSGYRYRGRFGVTAQPFLFTGTWQALNVTLMQIQMEFPFQETSKIAVKLLDKYKLEYYYVNN
jgi:hypothetical protein